MKTVSSSSELKLGELVKSEHFQDQGSPLGEVVEFISNNSVMIKINGQISQYHIGWLRKVSKLEKALK